MRGGAETRINIRTTVMVRAALEVRAAVARLSVPLYLVECGLREPDGWSLHQQRYWVAEWEAAAVKLSRSGSALKQLARQADSGHVVDQQQLQAALTYHQRVLDELHRVLDAVDRHRGTGR
ncbi:hypothetical protein [Saccharothrix syringae]|uniref:Uncharacterized protein n=1 Tax=Saccharothrix syringae TaxID=103733 RepID=A0A5Q0GUX1_SACSY|nr:hypothetical protein [Saccharothrix syringae]QFZ17711.1 hypothetical protein EKG83_09640 [Saccharothrix syringae]